MLDWRQWKIWTVWKWRSGGDSTPVHLERGRRGETAARAHLSAAGLKFLAANYRTPRGEIDLVFRDGPCLVFIEVKTRTAAPGRRPARAVDARRRKRLSCAALDYLAAVGSPAVPFRFDIVEVILVNDGIQEIRHLPNVFTLEGGLRYW